MRMFATVPQSPKKSAMVSSSADQGRFLTKTVLLPWAADTSTSDLVFFFAGSCTSAGITLSTTRQRGSALWNNRTGLQQVALEEVGHRGEEHTAAASSSSSSWSSSSSSAGSSFTGGQRQSDTIPRQVAWLRLKLEGFSKRQADRKRITFLRFLDAAAGLGASSSSSSSSSESCRRISGFRV